MRRIWNVSFRASLVFPYLLICVVIAGCGKDVFTAATPPPASTLGTGNWYITGFYQSGTKVLSYSFGGSLINNGGKISGTFHIDQTCFGNGATDVPYTGALDDKNTLSITSSPVDGQVLTFVGTLSSS